MSYCRNTCFIHKAFVSDLVIFLIPCHATLYWLFSYLIVLVMVDCLSFVCYTDQNHFWLLYILYDLIFSIIIWINDKYDMVTKIYLQSYWLIVANTKIIILATSETRSSILVNWFSLKMIWYWFLYFSLCLYYSIKDWLSRIWSFCRPYYDWLPLIHIMYIKQKFTYMGECTCIDFDILKKDNIPWHIVYDKWTFLDEKIDVFIPCK